MHCVVGWQRGACVACAVMCGLIWYGSRDFSHVGRCWADPLSAVERTLGEVAFEEDADDETAKFERETWQLVWGDKNFVSIFNGEDLTGWFGGGETYSVDEGAIVTADEGGDFLYSAKEYGDFILRMEFKLTAGSNNGIGLRVPKGMKGVASDSGMEIQLLDDSAAKFKTTRDYQRCGSIYGVVPAKKAALKPVGQWNQIMILARGNLILVMINGKITVNCKLDAVIANGAADGKPHVGLKRKKGHITFCAQDSRVDFRKIAIREFPPPAE